VETGYRSQGFSWFSSVSPGKRLNSTLNWMTVFWDFVLKLTNIPEVISASVIRAVSAVSNSDVSVNFYQGTWHNIPEDLPP
jgi:hypothetical protein